jgi:hypothetical protein
MKLAFSSIRPLLLVQADQMQEILAPQAAVLKGPQVSTRVLSNEVSIYLTASKDFFSLNFCDSTFPKAGLSTFATTDKCCKHIASSV